MPRDGTGNYNQPFPNVAPDTTIESVVYNGFTNDVALDLNTARPIVAGGTGATSADAALEALKGERASQLVTNYDSHVWQSGSFYSTASATGAPNGNAFAGICYLLDGSGGVGVEARDNTDGKLYLRAKTAGVWGPWTSDNAEMDTKKVNRAGDTMTAPLTIQGPDYLGTLHLGNTTVAKTRAIRIGVGSVTPPLEFVNTLNTAVTHTFGDNGDFSHIGAFSVGGSATIGGTITVGSEIWVSSGIIRFRNDATKYLFHDGSNYSLNGGPLTLNQDVLNCSNIRLDHLGNYMLLWDGGASTILRSAGTINFQNHLGTGWGYVNSTGIRSEGSITSAGGINAGTSVSAGTFIQAGAGITAGGLLSATGRHCRTGTAGVTGVNAFNIEWNGTPHLWIDASYIGGISIISDYRAKRDIAALPSTWEMVRQLRPISYMHKQFSPPSHQGDDPLIPEDNIRRWGFVAHELQEILLPSAAFGEKDMPNGLQSPNPWTIIAALTKTIQEMQERIEALEDA